jgi:hypothetical protein
MPYSFWNRERNADFHIEKVVEKVQYFRIRYLVVANTILLDEKLTQVQNLNKRSL